MSLGMVFSWKRKSSIRKMSLGIWYFHEKQRAHKENEPLAKMNQTRVNQALSLTLVPFTTFLSEVRWVIWSPKECEIWTQDGYVCNIYLEIELKWILRYLFVVPYQCGCWFTQGVKNTIAIGLFLYVDFFFLRWYFGLCSNLRLSDSTRETMATNVISWLIKRCNCET